MPELRSDPVTGRWVIISTERAQRPNDYIRERPKAIGGFCPFCEGNESSTPPEVYALRHNKEKNARGWSVRVVPNKFPALRIEGSLDKLADGIYDRMNGVGAHEVIIETPSHTLTLADESEEQFRKIIQTYRDRIKDLQGDKRFQYILIFKNQGRDAGASLEHSHTQIIALPIVPELVQSEMNGAQDYFKWKERCIFCDIVHQELKERTRVVSETDETITICPYAPRSPYEIWILPKKHVVHFETSSDKLLWELGVALREALLRLKILLGNPSYNFMLHNAPFSVNNIGYYHWHIEIMPKLTTFAGFEMGSGFYINPTPPEIAAVDLASVKI